MRSSIISVLFLCVSAFGAPLKDKELQAYFAGEVEKLEAACLPETLTRDSWEMNRGKFRRQLLEMLSLSPLPDKTDLQPVVTGTIEREGVVVEKLHFQSAPGLYVTANFYRPSEVTAPLPTILYLCGHSVVKTNGVSFGNKAGYQHHGMWFARNGYTCLTLDTIQLGEIEGLHHGTYREGMWWWNSRGYTPAGVEAWNSIRALDYLETRPEVDKNRFGVTGRSGGGAYSWWIAALDDRIKVAAPVAGITDLRNNVVDGVVEGHCDCMFFVNTYRWDYPMVAALVAPRPLLLCNSDKDTIFPLDGVLRTHEKIARLYRLYNAPSNLGLLITEGPHKDTQDLQLPVFRWFNRHLKGEDPIISMAAEKFFRPAELKVFKELPSPERTSRIHETFVPAASADSESAASPDLLRARVFNGWPRVSGELGLGSRVLSMGRNGNLHLVSFDSQPNVRLSMLVTGRKPDSRRVQFVVTDERHRPRHHSELLNADLAEDTVHAVLFVRGLELSDKLSRSEIQVRRRYMLIGQTLDGMRVWDIIRALTALEDFEQTRELPIQAAGEGNHASNLLLAAYLDDRLAGIKLPPVSEFEGSADYLNLLRFTSVPQIARELQRRGRLNNK